MKVLVIGAGVRQKDAQTSYGSLHVIGSKPSDGNGFVGLKGMELRCNPPVAGELRELVGKAGPIFAMLETEVTTFNSKNGAQQSVNVVGFEPICGVDDVTFSTVGIRRITPVAQPAPAAGNGSARPAPVRA